LLIGITLELRALHTDEWREAEHSSVESKHYKCTQTLVDVETNGSSETLDETSFESRRSSADFSDNVGDTLDGSSLVGDLNRSPSEAKSGSEFRFGDWYSGCLSTSTNSSKEINNVIKRFKPNQ
jgi:hypothetical protein